MSKQLILQALEKGNGVFRLAPTWVPRSFCRPGKRIKLHPDDYYALGIERGGIDERWLSSTTHADNGPTTPDDEGLSYIVVDENGNDKVLLRDAVDEFKGDIIGQGLYYKYAKLPVYSKFFDNLGPLPHHVHHRDRHAALVSQSGKPEMYFYPSQLNNYGGELPFTFFGFNPEVSKDQVKESLVNFTKGDNKLLDLSKAYKLTLDTGWDVPPGVLHAPGSLCTYEPQFASDVYAMYQSVLYFEHSVPSNLLWKNCPEDKVGDFEYLIEIIDWNLNVDPEFSKNRFMTPKPAKDFTEMQSEGFIDEWICYKNDVVSAKRLTVLPNKTVTIKDPVAYGAILIQGFGEFGEYEASTPTLIRYGELTNDEFFVTEKAANEGIVIKNNSSTEPLVMLKHFAENSDVLDLKTR